MNATVAEKVCTIREQLAERIGSERYQTWFGDSTQFDLELDRLHISVRNQFIGDWIRSHYLPELADATRDVVGSPIKVDVRVAEQAEHGQQPQAAALRGSVTAARNGQQRCVSPAPRSRRLRGELDAFVVGPSNALAYAAASTVVKSLAEAFKPLVIHGGCGLGKTHLLQGIFNAVARTHPALVQRYVSGEEFTNEFIYAVKGGRVDGFRARFRNVDLLLIDDIHFLANKKATQEEFLHTFNAIDTCGKQVVLSSDAHPRSIAALSEPLTNRFIAGMVVKLGPPDFKTRREILQRRAAQVRCDVPEEVIDFVAQHVTSNVRELEGSLYKLVALASLNKDPITLDLARAALEEQLIRSQKPIDAAEAYQLGLVNEVVPLDQLMATAERWANEILEAAPLAVRGSKEAAMTGMDYGEHLGELIRTPYPNVTAHMKSKDRIEGPAAFSEKRTPNWTAEPIDD